MVSGEYEVVVHEQVGDLVEIKYFKKYEHFKDWSNKEQQSDFNTCNSGESKERQLTPEDFGVYPKLVKLWGYSKTREELWRVIKHIANTEYFSCLENIEHLDGVFLWQETPQGYIFWKEVDEQLQNL